MSAVAAFSKMGITGSLLPDRRAVGRVTRDEWRALMQARADRVTAALPEGLKVDRFGQMYQVEGGTVTFHEFSKLIHDAVLAMDGIRR